MKRTVFPSESSFGCSLILSNLLLPLLRPPAFQLEAGGSRGKDGKWVIKHSTEGQMVEGTKRTRGEKLRAGEGRFLGVLGGEERGRKEGSVNPPSPLSSDI